MFESLLRDCEIGADLLARTRSPTRVSGASRMTGAVALAVSMFATFTIACSGKEGPPGASGDPGPAGPAAALPSDGLGLKIQSAEVDPTTRRLVVTFAIDDGAGHAISREGVETFWTVAALDVDRVSGTPGYVSYVLRPVTGKLGSTEQPTSDTKGRYEPAPGGGWRYVFSEPLPSTYDPARSLRIGAWARRLASREPRESWQVANAVLDFTPSGAAPVARDLVATSRCNSCHGTLSAHGGFRRDERLCVTCHTTQLVDPDTSDPALPGAMNPLDMGSLVHRIHQGKGLATIAAAAKAGVVGAKYSVVGYMKREFVYAETIADPRDPTKAQRRGVGFPQDTRNCVSCHADSPRASEWTTVATRRACASCHDATWFGAAANVPKLHHPHAGGPFADDKSCGTCHRPSGAELDVSVAGSHTVPAKSKVLAGLSFDIEDVRAAAGGNPTVRFRVTNRSDGTTVAPLSKLGALALTIGGPTREYSVSNSVRQDVRDAATLEDGRYTYTFPSRGADDPWSPRGPVIPAEAKGTFVVGVEGRRSVSLPGGRTVIEAGANALRYFSVDTSPVVERRTVVKSATCNGCHDSLSAHGGLRNETSYCVTCHTSDATDWARRPKNPRDGGNTLLAATLDGIEERSVHFKRMIHAIHTGESLARSRPYVIYGYGGSAHTFDEVRFPGKRSVCTTCHEPKSFLLEALPPWAAPTLANEAATILHAGTPAHRPGEPSMPPMQSSCLSCHDSLAALTHATLETGTGGTESCAVCHGEGRQFAVSRVHAKK